MLCKNDDYHPHVGDSGFEIFLTIVDVNNAPQPVENTATVSGRFRRPDGTVFERSFSLVTDGSDGQVAYTTDSTDLDMAGLWNLQIVVAGTTTWRTSLTAFKVDANI